MNKDNKIAPFNSSLWEEASDLSCKHMKQLAINELNKYRSFDTQKLYNPSCGKINNRDLELNILKGTFIDKKSCINKRPEYNKGNWEQNFAVYNPITGFYGCDMNASFIENTKSKMLDNIPCSYEKVLVNNGDNKKLTTLFNIDYYDSWDKMKENSINITNR